MHPWWPQRTRPPGSGPWPQNVDDTGSSARIALTSSNATVSADASFDLCSRTFQKATSSVVLLTVLSSTQDTDVDFVSAGGETGLTANASLVVSYGSGAAQKNRICDLRSGAYLLPPSEQVRLSVLVPANSSASGFFPNVQVAACIADAAQQAAPLDRMVYTYVNNSLTTAGANVPVPKGAREVDLWYCGATYSYGSGAPVLSLNAIDLGGFAQMVRDYTTGIWAPPYRQQVFLGAGESETTPAQLTLATTVNCAAVVQFLLGL